MDTAVPARSFWIAAGMLAAGSGGAGLAFGWLAEGVSLGVGAGITAVALMLLGSVLRWRSLRTTKNT